MRDLSELQVFAMVVESGGFSAAARNNQISKAFASKKVAALEDRLGVRLLNRTTRKMTMTQDGKALFARCIGPLKELEEVERTAAFQSGEMCGTLRVTAPMSFGQHYIAPATAAFLAKHPRLQVDLWLTDRLTDLLDEDFDLAIRIGELSDQSVIAVKVAPTRRFLVASPNYLEKEGTPQHPADLKQHQCLLYRYGGNFTSWNFSNGSQSETVTVKGPLITNNGEVLLAAATADQGLALLPDFLVCEPLQRGDLQMVLTDWCNWDAAVWALYPHRRHLSAKVREFIAFIKIFLAQKSYSCVQPD